MSTSYGLKCLEHNDELWLGVKSAASAVQWLADKRKVYLDFFDGLGADYPYNFALEFIYPIEKSLYEVTDWLREHVDCKVRVWDEYGTEWERPV